VPTYAFATVLETGGLVALSTAVRDAGVSVDGVGAHVVEEVAGELAVVAAIGVATVVLPSCWEGGRRRQVALGEGDGDRRSGEEGERDEGMHCVWCERSSKE
jgi:hypothetical protein